MRRLPVLGFNSAKYDINLILIPLMKLLKNTYENPTQQLLQSVIKKTNSFMSITTERLQFLDVTNYLAPGSSYSNYLKAFNIKEAKGFFPYEYVTEYGKLSEPSLPPYEAFYSKLKGANSLGEGEVGAENYEYLQSVWREHDMKTLADLLKWYNNLDVQPFMQAVEKQFDFFKNHISCDMFKEAISLPGLSLNYALRLSRAKFNLFGGRNQFVHKLLREHVVGGPSLVFSRYHEALETQIKKGKFGEEALTVLSVIGLDANALYLWAFAQLMPTGEYEIRKGPLFKKEPQAHRQYSRASIAWLEKVAKERKIHILHAENGSEVKLGSKHLKVDGFSPSTLEVFEFHGCYYHGCAVCTADRQDAEHPYHPGKTYADLR